MHLPSAPCSRFLHTSATAYAQRVFPTLDEWISTPKHLTLHDTLRREHLADLYTTIPTRDGVRRPWQSPENDTPLGYGHHLVFFHPRNPEASLRKDGTDADFCPPEPFTRRMWAGGRMSWNANKPLLVGRPATATSTIASIDKKGFDKGTPMLFVNQRIEITMDGEAESSVVEERSHVYLPVAAGIRRNSAREGA
ncbi:hypothetical protein ONZ45_g17801 [Pleurotus djamor]|nr:hypothetical protein ONZ45_g17801 [Pleurotus djamor]